MKVDLNALLVLAFLFFCGSLAGWFLEFFYRRFKKTNVERKWVNPGFLQGPYIPLYGFSLVMLFLMAGIPVGVIHNDIARKLVLFACMAVAITLVEYIAGLIFIKGMNIKLWDYSDCWGNIQGIICPLFSFYWMLLSALYYFVIHPKIVNSIYWLANHQTFSFFVGFFYGVFSIDLAVSLNILVKIRQFARENQIQVRYEEFKDSVIRKNENLMIRMRFMFPVRPSLSSFSQALKEYFERENKTSVLQSIIDGTLDGTKAVAETVVGGTKAVAGGVIEGTKAVAGGVVDGTKAVAGGVIEGTKAVAEGVLEGTKAVAEGVTKAVSAGFSEGNENHTDEEASAEAETADAESDSNIERKNLSHN